MTPEDIRQRLAATPEPDWVRRMKDCYRETGRYRPEDLRRVLGDPTRSVEVGPKASLPKNFAR